MKRNQQLRLLQELTKKRRALKMRSKLLFPVITLFVGALLFGTTYSAWVFNNSADINNTVQVEVPT
jgi:hypothetical protein